MSAGYSAFQVRAHHEAPLSVTSLNSPPVLLLSDVRSAAHYGLKSDIAPSPKSARGGLEPPPRIRCEQNRN